MHHDPHSASISGESRSLRGPVAWALGVGMGLALGGAVSCKSKSSQVAAQQAAAKAETDAVAVAETEALLGEIRYLRAEVTKWYVKFGLEANGGWAPKLVAQGPDKKNFENRISAAAMIKPGNLFFTDGAFKERFRFNGMAPRDVIDIRTNVMMRVTVAEFEDLRSGKAGTKYHSQQGLPESEIEAHAYFDRTAILDFGKADGDKTEIKVEEGTSFPLPGGKGESCLLKEVTDEQIVIEYAALGGERKTRPVPLLKK